MGHGDGAAGCSVCHRRPHTHPFSFNLLPPFFLLPLPSYVCSSLFLSPAFFFFFIHNPLTPISTYPHVVPSKPPPPLWWSQSRRKYDSGWRRQHRGSATNRDTSLLFFLIFCSNMQMTVKCLSILINLPFILYFLRRSRGASLYEFLVPGANSERLLS